MQYFCFGSGAKALVILPGLSVQSVMSSADAVVQQYADMARDFKIYLLDRRESLPAEYSLNDMARDTAEAITALGLKDIYLFGASQGGMMAMLIAAAHPELVKKLVLGSTAAQVTDGGFALIKKWISLAEERDGEALYTSFGKSIYPQAVFEQYREVLKAAGAGVTDAEFERFIILAKSLRGFDACGRLGEICCPVLVLGASDDRVLGANAAEQLAKSINNCSLHIYNGYGHAAYDTAPDYRQRMLKFFT